MLKFYMAPGSCSTGIHLLLEEIGLVFEAHIVNMPAGDHRQPAYLALNPKGTVPTLVRDDGSAITDYVAIAWWLALQYPRRKLLPESIDGQIHALEMLNDAVATMHGQGWTRIFTPERYLPPEPTEADRERLTAQGREIVMQGMARFEAALDGQDWLLGNYSIADSALFYNAFWAQHLKWPLPERVQAHQARMRNRPAVRQVLAEEGYR